MKHLIGLGAGIFLGYHLQIPTDEKVCAVILFAAIDSLCGGFAAEVNQSFSDFTLICGFFTDVAFGIILILLGNFFEIDLYYIALFIFGLRIFKNISLLKCLLLKKYNT